VTLASKPGAISVHNTEISVHSISSLQKQLTEAIEEQYQSASNFFVAFSDPKNHGITRTGFRGAVRSLGLHIPDQHRKQLRKAITTSKLISLEDLQRFVSDLLPAPEKALCALPADLPQLPSNFQIRKDVEKSLIDALIGGSKDSVAVTAPSSRPTSHRVLSQGGLHVRIRSCIV
jgi:hypothetical protein